MYLPKERIAFTGDILFNGYHPIIWQGPVSNWIAACDRLLDLDVELLVPGHGPIADKMSVQKTKAYWLHLIDVSKKGYQAGVTPDDTARQLLAEGFVDWSESSRLAVNIDTITRELAGDSSPRDPLSLLARMARLEQKR